MRTEKKRKSRYRVALRWFHELEFEEHSTWAVRNRSRWVASRKGHANHESVDAVAASRWLHSCFIRVDQREPADLLEVFRCA